MVWKDPVAEPPDENTDVLVYTDEDKMKVARLCRGRWDTYMQVVSWCLLPKDKPTKVGKKKSRK